MVHFSKLKLYGFKSFVDKTELEIGPGLNGIVGPNGCGKSNLVEALRWVMGEKSAKNMRGAGMEDVIFAGTSKRPARSLAEVTVVMNNEDGTAPAPFNTATEIEINRKIEKDKGSQYRVNGKAVRARDVNLLFADTMTGASSPALVSQGRITEIIVAKPADRRKILEESAGISGLHTRRHEAELRLRAAEQNLTRLDDSLNETRSRLSSLKRQARQAERYKELSDQIRKVDMAIGWSEWQTCHTKMKSYRTDFDQSNTGVQEALIATQSLTKSIEEIEKTLPDTRKNHMDAAAKLQSLRVSLDRLDQDIKTRTKGLQDALEIKSQLDKDKTYLQDSYETVTYDLKEAQTALSNLQDTQDDLPKAIASTQKELEDKQAELLALTTSIQSLQTQMGIIKNERASTERQMSDVKTQKEKQKQKLNDTLSSIKSTKDHKNQINNDDILSFDFTALNHEMETSATSITSIQKELDSLSNRKSETQSKYNDVNNQINSLSGELQALNNLINKTKESNTQDDEANALLNAIDVEKGYEKALSAALGQFLSMAGTNEDASVYWSNSHANVETPSDATALLEFVTAPRTLHPLLKATGICDALPDDASSLKAGQCLITKSGAMMRWDGLYVCSDIKSQDNSAIILEQKNRVIDIEKTLKDLIINKEAIKKTLDQTHEKNDNLNHKISELRSKKQQLEKQKTEKTFHYERVKDKLASYDSQLQEMEKRLSSQEQELADIDVKLADIETQISQSDDNTLNDFQGKIDAINATIANTQNDVNTTQSHLSDLKQQLKTREDRARDLKSAIERLSLQSKKAQSQHDDLNRRIGAIDDKIDTLKTEKNMDNTDELRDDLFNKITFQETECRNISDILNVKETEYKSLQNDLRKAENNAAQARENRAVLQTNIANINQDMERIQSDIEDRFELNPQQLEERVFSLFDSQIPAIGDLHNEKDTVTRQRDGIGPVNLRAAIESQEAEKHLADMEGEHNDLTKAIDQLRSGISKLNKEAQERLDIAFARVNQHFQRLFNQLFEGGQAYLSMVKSEDPLESGLEIFAQPPGKSLQKLSLLSGGEQTLTATALIFGMFLTNPSPICVLDEIDAPLDDANVDRICTLMEKIAQDTDTRFIVITHHRMTMARMDRLYGVTMSERGVSQLVSVDIALQGEMDLAQTAS